MNEFKQTKIKFKHIFQDILGKDQSYELDEAAFPAYAHKNPLIDYLFWKRIQVAYDYGSKSESKQRVLDFGCGSGVLTYLLANEGHEVTSIDLEFGPLNRVKEKTQFPNGIRFLEGNIKTMGLPEKSFDLIYALDVLEHIDNLQDYITLFETLLTDKGRIIVSGPTENVLYKLGRKLAGSRFTGDYHVTDISKIKKAFERTLKVTTIKKLIFPVVLFELFVAGKNGQPI